MSKSIIAQAIEGNSLLVFKPNLDFYQKVGINQKRWGLIYKGKLEPTLTEVERVADFFKIPVTNFLTKNPLTGANCQGV